MTHVPSDTSDSSTNTFSAADHGEPQTHADKYNDPRVRITRRGVLIGLAVCLMGILGAIASIYARRTRLELTTRFWGDETIMALQLAERIELKTAEFTDDQTIELSGMPGLGHLRRALLDERNYVWTTAEDSTAEDSTIEDICSDENSRCVQLRLSDPTAKRFEPIEINLDLETGWLGPASVAKRVQVNDRVRTALKSFLDTVLTFEQKRYDLR